MKLTNQRKILSCLVAGTFLLSSASFANVEKTLRWDYDSYGRLTTEQVGNQEAVSYSEFSISDVPKKLTYNESVIVDNIILNNDGTSQNVVYGGDKSAQADFTYSDFSSPLTSVLNVNGQLAFSEVDMQYDSRGYLNALKKRYQNSDIDYTYNYDAMGKLTTFGVDGSTVNYGYDVRGNLVSKTGFKANGLEVTPLATQSYNTKYQNTAWTYDGDGNLIEDDEFTYKYNDANRLALVINKNSGEWVAHYIYDSSGNRVRTMTQETTTYFYRNAVGSVVKEEVFDNITRELIRSERHINAGGLNIASVKQQRDQSEEIEYQFNGRLGSQSVRWTDAGEVITQDYSPFGEQMNKDNLHSGTYGFTQHEDDLETDSTYMKARHYKSSYGRMTRPDPARDFNVLNASSMNLYAYVGNNPVNAWDPTGLETQECTIDMDDCGESNAEDTTNGGRINDASTTLGYKLKSLLKYLNLAQNQRNIDAEMLDDSLAQKAKDFETLSAEEYDRKYNGGQLVDDGAFVPMAGGAIVGGGIVKSLAKNGVKKSAKQNVSSLGKNWKPLNVMDSKNLNGCEVCARYIRRKIGGTIHTIKPQGKAPSLGKYRGKNTGWDHHDVVVKNGRVYDGFGPADGTPINEFKGLFQEADVIDFGF